MSRTRRSPAGTGLRDRKQHRPGGHGDSNSFSLDDVLAALLRHSRIFAVRFKGEREERYVAAEYIREVAINPRAEKIIASPSLLRQHPDLFEVRAA